jgi:hypothetical protein
MNATLRHLSLRLWVTALAGGMICVIVLPWWQRIFGLEGLLIPVVILLVACFLLIGRSLDKLGLVFIRRLVNEAAVWERAGMTTEAEAVYQRAVALFDSFLFSPLQRRRRAPWFTARLARFYLGQSSRSGYAHSMVRGYLLNHPTDEEVASAWLEQLLNCTHYSRLDHEAIARIGEATIDNAGIQQLLMECHLANGRVDFHAMQTYQRVWRSRQPLAEALLIPLVGLLLQEGLLSHWALRVYLDAFERKHQPALEGIAGCACWLHPTVENRRDLTAAKNVLTRFDTDHVTALARRFKPAQPAKTGERSVRRTTIRANEWFGDMGNRVVINLSRAIKSMGALATKIGQGAAPLVLIRRTVVAVTIITAVVALAAIGRQIIKNPAENSETEARVAEVPVVKDPFTIQVAAYLKSNDAQRFVEQLKQHGLDAFWTEATSANRKWYQVKVSHFGTKDQARLYGQELKSKGLIDDYYVANYGLK